MKFENRIWCVYFLSKIFYMFLALFVYSKLTSLGDTERYLNGEPFKVSFETSTHIMDFLAGTSSFIFGNTFGNMPFVLLSFFGVYYPIRKLELNNNQLITLLLLLSFPNFGIWTSIASKEAVAVFYMGLILGYIIDLIKKNPTKNYLFFIFGILLCWKFKSQYLIGISGGIAYIIIHNTLKLKKIENLIILILIILTSLFFLYIYRNEINQLAFEIPGLFSLDAGSTRPNTIFVNNFDVFWNSLRGMFLAFFGPTLSEALSKMTHFWVFIESFIIISLFIYTLIKIFKISFITGKLNIYFFGIFFIISSWILFVHYPTGVLNPGSAVRYRQGFYSFIVILYFFLYTEIIKNYFRLKKK